MTATEAARIKGQLREAQVTLLTISRRYDAIKQLHDAACFAGDGALAAGYREELHGLLDAVLDTVAGAMALSRQLISAGY